MKNKQKLWRRAAASVKRQMVAKGKHIPGDRYGTSVRIVQNGPAWKPMPSMLFVGMAAGAGWLGDTIR